MVAIGRFTIPPDHPSLPGHFPGQPMVPGVVLLDHALALLAADRPGTTAIGFAAVKFAAAVLPGETVEVRCDAAAADHRVRFRAYAGEREVLSGGVLLGAP